MCFWSLRSELETDKRIASSLTGGTAQLSLNQPPPPPAVSAWGSGPPPAIKPVGFPGSGLSDLGVGPPLPGSDASFFDAPLPGGGFGMSHMGGGGFGSMDQMSSAGDFLDPMGGGNMGLSQSSNGSRGADSSSAWDQACSSIHVDLHGGGGSSSDPLYSQAVMEPFGVLEIMLTTIDDDDEEMCTICFDELANGCLKPCGHRFCSTCIKQLKKRAVFLATEGVMCPHCRQPVKEFQLPNNNVLSSSSTTKTAWGTSSKPTPAPAPIPPPPMRVPVQPKPQPPKQSNGPPAAAAAKAIPVLASPALTAAPARVPDHVPAPSPAPTPAPAAAASRADPQSSFGSFAGGGGNMWGGAGQGAGAASSSLQMPQPGGGGGMGGFGGAGWSSSAFGGLPSLNTDPVFTPSEGLWSAGAGSGLDSWSAGPSAFDSSAGGGWDSFQMPGAGGGGGGFGGSGFGGLGGGGSGSLQQVAIL